MTTAVQMYKGVLFELDKYASPDFDAEDFNYFMPKAIEKWLKQELDVFEQTQKVVDKLSPLIKVTDPALVYNATNATDVRELVLPSDYRHVVSCLVRLRYKTATTANALNAIRLSMTKRLTGDAAAFTMDNFYLKPLVSDADIRLYHRIIGNKLAILFDTPAYQNTTVVIQDVTLEYIAKAPEISLNPDFTTLIDTVFPVHANKEIVSVCAQLFLENNESQRLQSHAAVNQ